MRKSIRAASAATTIPKSPTSTTSPARSTRAPWGYLDKETALTRYTEAIGLIDIFEADQQLAAEALSTAIRYNHSVYDMLNVILARRHSCKVLTVDKTLATLIRQLDESMLLPPTESGPT
jgi:predicted nucleic acid-binding protein